MSRARLAVAATVCGALLLVVGILLGRVLSPGVAAPSTDSAAAGFLRDMQVHHAQAVQMALIVRDRTDDETIRTIAYDMAVTQASQSGSMYGLLEAWSLPQRSPSAPMTWTELPTIDGSAGGGHSMDADAPAGMPGMATNAQIAQLEAATGDEAVRLFLTLMIAHHRGGLEMAEAVLARSDVPQVVELAAGIQRSQGAEITVMQDLLAKLPPA